MRPPSGRASSSAPSPASRTTRSTPPTASRPTTTATAARLPAFYTCVGEQQAVPRSELRGTIQTDTLKEYMAQKEWIFPPEPSMRLVTDMVEFCATELPRWHPISISGYHIREA